MGRNTHLIVIRRPDRARWDLDRLAARSGEDLDLAEAGLPEWAEALDSQDRATDEALGRVEPG